VLVYPSAMTVSTRTLRFVAEALRAHRRDLRTRWRLLSSGRQALMVLAHLRKGETYRDLAVGFGVATTTAYRYLREGLTVLAALAPTLAQAMAVAARKAYVTLDGTLLRIDRVAMASKNDRPYYSGKAKAHTVNVQVIADPAGRLIWASPALPGARHDPGCLLAQVIARQVLRLVSPACTLGVESETRLRFGEDPRRIESVPAIHQACRPCARLGHSVRPVNACRLLRTQRERHRGSTTVGPDRRATHLSTNSRRI